MTKQLKPCPFCGGKAKFIIDPHENSDTSQRHKIYCTGGCGANMGDSISGWSPDYGEQVQALFNRWNKRTNAEDNKCEEEPKKEKEKLFQVMKEARYQSIVKKEPLLDYLFDHGVVARDKGEWIVDKEKGTFRCPFCGTSLSSFSGVVDDSVLAGERFCYNCGADMRGGKK